jgi:hypothetical protein
VTAAYATLSGALQERLAPLVKGGISINDPKSIKALPEPLRRAIQEGFVAALHPLFLVSASVTLLAVILCVALPNKELKGPGPAGPATPAADRAPDDEQAAADLEAKAATMI